MAEQTGISWCDATMNPWVGCSKVSPGCAHCYAETLVTGRMGRAGTWGDEGERQRTSKALWRKPLCWAALAREGLLPDGERNRDGHRPRVFCASLADVFEPRPELKPWRDDLFDLIERTPELDWLLLTKRAEEARDWLNAWYFDRDNYFRGMVIPLPNVWIGTSIENARFTWRADVLRETPAAVRFISAEPLLGSLYDSRPLSRSVPAGIAAPDDATEGSAPTRERAPLDLTGVDWIIAGGESGGRDARPMRPEWAREIRDACLCPDCGGHGWIAYAAHAPGCNGLCSEYGCPVQEQEQCDPCGGRGTRIPFHFKQFGSHDENGVYVGASPKSGGCLLDGREWKEFPRGLAVAV